MANELNFGSKVKFTLDTDFSAPDDDNDAATKKYVDDVVASDISTSTTNFNNILSSSDNTIQKALDTLDNLTKETTTITSSSPYNVSSSGNQVVVAIMSGGTINLPQISSNNHKQKVKIHVDGSVTVCTDGTQKIRMMTNDASSVSASLVVDLVANNDDGKWYGWYN